MPGGRLYEQREVTVRELRKIPGVSVVKNDATFYIFPKLDVKRFHITDDEKFAMDFLHEKHVMIVPGRGFWLVAARPLPHRHAAGTGNSRESRSRSGRFPRDVPPGSITG